MRYSNNLNQSNQNILHLFHKESLRKDQDFKYQELNLTNQTLFIRKNLALLVLNLSMKTLDLKDFHKLLRNQSTHPSQPNYLALLKLLQDQKYELTFYFVHTKSMKIYILKLIASCLCCTKIRTSTSTTGHLFSTTNRQKWWSSRSISQRLCLTPRRISGITRYFFWLLLVFK